MVAHQLHRLLKPGGVRLAVFERSVHRPWTEEPERYFTELFEFLA